MFSSPPPLISSLLLFLSLSLFLFVFSSIVPFGNQPQTLISPADELDDLDLFHKAVTSAAVKPHRRPARVSRLRLKNPRPKIAFLFLTNSDLVFFPLWERFFHGHEDLHNVYVHADPSVELTPLQTKVKVQFIPAKRTERASPSLISASRRLLARSILDDSRNLYFVLLSQHCVPLHSFDYTYRSLFGNRPIKAFTEQSVQKSFIEILSNEPFLGDRYAARGEQALLPEIRFDDFRVGSQFFVLAKRHALMVIKERKLWKKFKLPCLNRDSCYPEEHYFPTLLSMEDPNGCSHYTLTRVNWTGSVGGHPHTYIPPEVSPELIKTLRSSNTSNDYLFARKFTPDCLQPLMEIADDVLFRN